MSAYIEGREHIAAIVRVAVEGPSGVPIHPGWWYAPLWKHQQIEPDDLGAALWAENVASVEYRYSDSVNEGLPGPIDDRDYRDVIESGSFRYDRRDARHLTTGEALLAIDGLEYQSCEHPGWLYSEAFTFLNALRSSLIGTLPEYRAAETWSI